MKKTPVSMLQEMMVKKGESPNYELVYNGGGSHQNVFTFQVSCDGLKASGTGRCKKDAKHEAATAMLEAIAEQTGLLQLPASPCKSPVRTPSPKSPECQKSTTNVPFRNTIGELKDLCSVNNLEDPLYRETGNIGPAHAKVFTVQCLVSTFIEEGTATTKKQAKHEAARKMLNRISNVVTDDLVTKLSNCKASLDIQNKLAIARYTTLNKINSEPIKLKVNWGIKISNYYKSFKEKFTEQEKDDLLVKLEDLSAMINDGNKNSCTFNEELKEKFESLLTSLDIQFSYYNYSFNKRKDPQSIISIHLNTAPDIQEFGFGETIAIAEIHAIKHIIKTLKQLLQ